MSELELHRNATPAVLKADSDWAENGLIDWKEQMQSEYWGTKYFSLLNMITSFLVSASWKDCTSALKAKAEVTVQPDNGPVNSIKYVAGSYFATVEDGSDSVGSDVDYVVTQPDGSAETVPRHRLRHRVWHTVAFLGITNEKRHVAVSTQTFFARQLEFWRIWNEEGRDAALAFAACDRATAVSANLANVAADIDADDADGEHADTPTNTTAPASADTTQPAAAASDAFVAATAAASRVAAASSAAAFSATNPEFADFLRNLDHETFWAWIGHADNATHFKSSGNFHWWSHQRDALSSFVLAIWLEFGCPGKGKGPWDGLGAVVKTKVRNDITNNKCFTASKRIRSALEVAEHLRAVFCNPDWLKKHAHMKINEIVVFYIDKHEKDSSFPSFKWPAVDPIYSTVTGISKKYCFMMRGRGRVASRRFSCWCEPCYLALQCPDSMTAHLDIPNCKRHHLSSFKSTEQTVTCTAAAGLANAKTRAKALWLKLKPLLRAGKFTAVQAWL